MTNPEIRSIVAKRMTVTLNKMDRALWLRAVEAGKPFWEWPSWLCQANYARLVKISYSANSC